MNANPKRVRPTFYQDCFLTTILLELEFSRNLKFAACNFLYRKTSDFLFFVFFIVTIFSLIASPGLSSSIHFFPYLNLTLLNRIDSRIQQEPLFSSLMLPII